MAAARLLFLFLVYNTHMILSMDSGYVEVIMERAQITCDKEWFEYCNCTVFRYNRSTPYIFNLNYLSKKPLEKGVVFSLKSYEWKNNQFKESFIGFTRDFCDFLEKDMWIMGMLKDYVDVPRKCPVKPGVFHLNNFHTDISKFPRGFPLSKWNFVFKSASSTLKRDLMVVDLIFDVRRATQMKSRTKVRPTA